MQPRQTIGQPCSRCRAEEISWKRMGFGLLVVWGRARWKHFPSFRASANSLIGKTVRFLHLGRLFRKEDSWTSHPLSSSRCFSAAWGSSPFSGCCSGCGCALTSEEQWWWSQGPPLAWGKVGMDSRVPKGQGAVGGSCWNRAALSSFSFDLRGGACRGKILTTLHKAEPSK